MVGEGHELPFLRGCLIATLPQRSIVYYDFWLACWESLAQVICVQG
jgi:hypothetical protein